MRKSFVWKESDRFITVYYERRTVSMVVKNGTKICKWDLDEKQTSKCWKWMISEGPVVWGELNVNVMRVYMEVLICLVREKECIVEWWRSWILLLPVFYNFCELLRLNQNTILMECTSMIALKKHFLETKIGVPYLLSPQFLGSFSCLIYISYLLCIFFLLQTSLIWKSFVMFPLQVLLILLIFYTNTLY